MLSEFFMAGTVPLEHVVLGGFIASIALTGLFWYESKSAEADAAGIKDAEADYLTMTETLHLTKLATAQKVSEELIQELLAIHSSETTAPSERERIEALFQKHDIPLNP